MSIARLLPLPVLAAVLIFAQRVSNFTYTWNPVRIVAGGYVPGFVAHPTQPGLIYLRTDIGGVYRWNNGTWLPLLDYWSGNFYQLTGPESIALDPTDPNRLYIAAGMYTCGGCSFAILASTDQGATFTTYQTPFQMGSNNDGRAAGERLAVNPFHPNELFMGTRKQGLWKSSNNAQSWSQVTSFPVQSSSDGFGVQWVVFDPKHSGTIYVGSYTNAGVYLSTDGGATWTRIPGQPLSWPFIVPFITNPPEPNRAVLNPDGNLYVTYGDYPGPNTMNYGMVQKFNPSTGAWTNITPPYDTADGQTTALGGFNGISQDPTRPGTIAVSTFNRWYPVDTIYITHDGGSTWIDLGRVTSAAGFKGLNAGNFYFNPSVFSFAPWLTFGNTSTPAGSAKFGWWISALLIDPANPQHLMFGTGATIYGTNNLSVVDNGQSPAWTVQGMGVEETAVQAMISPLAGAHLLSGVGDIGGFRHDDFNVSPAGGMYTNPVATTVGSLDWAGQNPLLVTRTQSPNSASTSPCTWGALSSDGGTTWAPLPACASGVNNSNGGTLAVDASGTMLAWTPPGYNSGIQISNDGGTTWKAATGLPASANVVADKVTPQLFYALFNEDFYSTTGSGGTAFTKVSSSKLSICNAGHSSCGKPVVNFAKSGDIWVPFGTNGLYHSTDGGATWKIMSNVPFADSLAIGASPGRGAPQAIYVYGSVAPPGPVAIYQSLDNGATWSKIGDDRYGGPTLIAADSRVFGRVFLGMNGRGIIYGEIAERERRLR
ncbi:MAG TPA: hypothetical protein VMT15_09170 [Bryobacteraceae bacterium]|nr:hypothetical protein [Bryobacteraceae bacterium]